MQTKVDIDDQDLASSYGLRALATVVFDIDVGQKLDALYPSSCGLSEAAKTSLAHLSLPHCNNQDEGDTQYIVRFRDGTEESVSCINSLKCLFCELIGSFVGIYLLAIGASSCSVSCSSVSRKTSHERAGTSRKLWCS